MSFLKVSFFVDIDCQIMFAGYLQVQLIQECLQYLVNSMRTSPNLTQYLAVGQKCCLSPTILY